MLRGFWLALLVSFALVACWRSPSGPALPRVSADRLHLSGAAAIPSGKIKHIVFIIQENRTFDNLFGGPSPFPNATATDSGYASDSNEPIKLAKIYLATSGGTEDPDNYHRDWMWACHPDNTPPPTTPPGSPSPCRMNGFNIAATPSAGYTPPASVKTIYSYVDYSETEPYRELATKYTLGDHFFMSHNSESYTAHQYIFSAQSNNVVDSPDFNKDEKYCGQYYDYCAFTPWGCDSPPGTTTFKLNPNTGVERKSTLFPCFGRGFGTRYPALAQRVDDAGLTWRLYAHSLCQNINALDVNAAVRFRRGLWPEKPDMSKCHEVEGGRATPVDTKNFRMPEYTFFKDISDTNRELANVTWILPGIFTSDHPGVPFGWCGPSWVAKLVNAIGKSKYWDSTVIFVFWDDWGGYYDHVKPYIVRDAAGPGFRVPLLVISPYAKRNVVAHTETEFGTLLKFTEETLGLEPLGGTDTSPYVHGLDDFFQNNAQPFVSVDPQEPVSCKGIGGKRDAQARSRWVRMLGD
jgi:phospholipase C